MHMAIETLAPKHKRLETVRRRRIRQTLSNLNWSCVGVYKLSKIHSIPAIWMLNKVNWTKVNTI